MPATDSVAGLLLAARGMFERAGVDTPALDARLLLQAATSMTHADIIADADRVVDPMQRATFNDFVARRLAHEPVSKILGRREFFGRDFFVTKDVLDPRADTETLLSLCLDHYPADRTFRFLDLGSGSGAIAVTLLAERRHAAGLAVDVSPLALAVTQRNAHLHHVDQRLRVLQSDMFASVTSQFDLLISNPPYIPRADIASLSDDVRMHDPLLALDGGADGLDYYRHIANHADSVILRDGMIAIEIGAGQADQVVNIFAARQLRLLESRNDLAGHVRALAFKHV